MPLLTNDKNVVFVRLIQIFDLKTAVCEAWQRIAKGYNRVLCTSMRSLVAQGCALRATKSKILTTTWFYAVKLRHQTFCFRFVKSLNINNKIF